tara:strand:- start:18 stop:386 length:369 start_codon:yes stop_codon:yes gene_type:complete
VDKRNIGVIPEFRRTTRAAYFNFVPFIGAGVHPKCLISMHFSEATVVIRDNEAPIRVIYLIRRDICEKIIRVRRLLIKLTTCGIPSTRHSTVNSDSLAVDSFSPTAVLISSVGCSAKALHKI